MKQHSAIFANFICRFGDKKVLLDYVTEIVIPAFTNDTYVRSYADRTHYHFYEVGLINVSDDEETPVLALAGRFIKDTELTRHQIFDEREGLIRDEQRMRSAPSVFFLLILNNHRLVYMPETPHAPDLKTFKTTAESFLKRRYSDYIDEQHELSKAEGQKVTKKSLREENPSPTLEVIALTGVDDVAEFIKRYETLRRINFRLVMPNDDIDAGEILEQVREFGRDLNSDRTNLTAANNDGLDIDASIEAVTAATETGNQEVTLSGIDHEGNRLSGNNERFQVSAPVEPVPPTRRGLVTKLFEVYQSLIASGTIRAPSVDRSVDRIRQLTRLL